MPELPEVEAVCRKLRCVEGRRIVGAKVIRCAAQSVARRVTGRGIERIDRRGKHILMRLEGGLTVHTHLKMTGNLYAIPDQRLPPACARVILELDDDRAVVFEDSRALGRMEAVSSRSLDRALAGELGPEPLSPEFTAESLWNAARKARQPAKIFLMDQRRIAGLGNIYAAEALFRSRIGPRTPMARLSRRRVDALHEAIVAVLTEALESACRAYGGPGEFSEAEDLPLAVYGREDEACFECGKRIRRIVQGGRSTYYCPSCQR
jgi:formamidopyrimidine-DNA glycosylase